MRTLQKAFMQKLERETDVFAKRADCLDEIERAIGVSQFKFGTNHNSISSDETRDWAIYHLNPERSLNDETVIENGISDVCMACNLRRKVGSLVYGRTASSLLTKHV